MEDIYLTLNQNLCSAKIFLNLFNLYLEEKEEVRHYDKLKIFNSENQEVGKLEFKDGIINIESLTSLGKLSANYEISKFWGLNDLEFGGGLVEWVHNINFNIDGEQKFDGDLQIDIVMDTDFGKYCRTHSIIRYIDKDNNNVVLKFMNDGKPFSYEAKRDDFREVLEVDPWSDFESYMYHIIRDGKYDKEKSNWPYESLKFVWHNGDNDKNHLRTISQLIENYKYKEWKKELYKKSGTDKEATIQKGLLMHKIDSDFSKKIEELINLFKKDNVSFFTNLINVTFDKVSEEEIKALFGTDIQKIVYYNGENNLLDAYFNTKRNNQFLPENIYSKVLKK